MGCPWGHDVEYTRCVLLKALEDRYMRDQFSHLSFTSAFNGTYTAIIFAHAHCACMLLRRDINLSDTNIGDHTLEFR